MLRKRLSLVAIGVLLAVALSACGDSPTATSQATTAALATTKAATTAAVATTSAAATTAAPATTSAVAATTAAVAATTTASTATTTAATGTTPSTGQGTLGQVPAYPGATTLTVPDALASQVSSSFSSSLGSTQVKNLQSVAFGTTDDAAKIKAFYTDYFNKNGWTDATASAGGSLSQVEGIGGFGVIYTKGTQAFFAVGFPAAAASAIGFTGANVPTTGIVVIGFSAEGDLPTIGGTGATPTTAAVATTAATSATTAATSATTAATGTSGGSDIELYTGATPVTLSDAVKTQFTSSLGSSLDTPEVAAFVSADNADKIKTFYTDSLTKGGYTDATSLMPAASTSQITGLGGFVLSFARASDKRVVVLLGLPSATAAAFGVTNAPANGTFVIGISGTTK